VPDNITPIFLPSRAPELNPVENVWQYLRQNWPPDTVFEDYDAIVDAACALGESSSPSPKRSPSSECAAGLTSVTRYDLRQYCKRRVAPASCLRRDEWRQSCFTGSTQLGLPVVCIESRQAYQALKSLATHKTDRNDAQGLAHLARPGFFKPVHVK
jgi:DDE superfamily endonuclease